MTGLSTQLVDNPVDKLGYVSSYCNNLCGIDIGCWGGTLMLRPGCQGCAHLKRNQCEVDKAMPINMEIGSMVEYVTDPEKDRSCSSFVGGCAEDPELR